jgi:hypothetical protein
MIARFIQTFCLLTIVTHVLAGHAQARSIYLNGKDVSSARNQQLKRVDLRIDEDGNVFIEAPHYQINEEKTYAPLRSKPQLPIAKPQHLAPGPIPERLNRVPAEVPQAPVEKPADTLQNEAPKSAD